MINGNDLNTKTVAIQESRLRFLESRNKVFGDACPYIWPFLYSLNQRPCSLDLYDYGCVISANKVHSLLATHDFGLFSNLCTIMWTIIDIGLEKKPLPGHISTKFSMNHFKSEALLDNYHSIFCAPTSLSLDKLQSLLNAWPTRFDAHDSYHDLFSTQPGREWIQSYFDAYMVPAPRLRERINFFIDKYSIKSKKTVVVCYRGTDKHVEVRQDPLDYYCSCVSRLIDSLKAEQLIVQTDQLQVRGYICEKFGLDFSVFIEELPCTTGSVVMHLQNEVPLDKDSWAIDLIAMVYALSNAMGIVTHSGNIGFFMSMFALSLESTVIQCQ